MRSNLVRWTLRNDGQISFLAFNPQTSELYAGSHDKKIYAVDLSTSTITNTFEGHTDWVYDLAVSPNGTALISVSDGKSARIWDISNEGGGGKEVKVIEEDDYIRSVTISPDSTYFCTGGYKTIDVYDMSEGDYELLTKLEGNYSLTSSSDGTRLFSGSNDNTVKIWDTTSPNADQWTLLKTLVEHTSSINSLSLSPCSRYLATSDDETVRVWIVELGALLRTMKSPKMTDVKGVSYGSDNTILSASTDGRVRAWNLGAKAQEPLKLEGHSNRVYAVAISSDGSTEISGSHDSSVRVWDAPTGEQKALLEGHTERVFSVDISKDGKLAISGSFDKTVIIWSLEGEAKELKKRPSTDNKIIAWTVESGEQVSTLEGHTDTVWGVDLTPDNSKIVSSSEDKTAKLRQDMENLELLARKSQESTDAVTPSPNVI
ncbi:hypothetical protein TL16_g12971 [Triparma laevis f. inornata]|uniref:WD40 repeat-like protein n=1 Tax=Triparma laevis f. inornata TaxID=1714386 RepID=A0A9W7EYP9_9STRA|nr:hypothetical protein TL16_g12971 [Triparma laevis f. inornata]